MRITAAKILALCITLAAVACNAPPEPLPTTEPQATLSPAATPSPPARAPAREAPPTAPPPEMVTCIDLASAIRRTWSVPFVWSAMPFQNPRQDAAITPGCIAQASGTGVQFNSLANAYNAIAATMVLQGWHEDTRYQTGAATAATGGFRNGERLCLAVMDWTPSGDAVCPPDASSETCELKPEQRIFLLRLQCGVSAVLRRDEVLLAADSQMPDQPAAYLDADAGVAGDAAHADIKLAVVRTRMAFVMSNGATAYVAGDQDPGFAGCRKAQDAGSFTIDDVKNVAAGLYFCVTTDKGNLVVLRVDDASQNTVVLSLRMSDAP